ncbi:extracellular solute-binding protein [Streptomyces sodiiphilus]|uniref:Extracellular solute-binding protein n=2 Tax=Streptomyces sodiiphilus TaxID=226217 RepID=A0ABN2NQW1_9ACTN
MSAGLAGAVGLSATACGADGGTAGGEVTLTLVATEYGTPDTGGGAERYWLALIQRFRQQHPNIQVDVTVLGREEVATEVSRMVREGRAPDIAQLGSYADFAAAGELYPVRELLSIPVQADFVAAFAAAGEVRRTQYGIPFTASTWRLFYNKGLFRDAGLDPEAPPETWEELAEAAAALKAAGVPVPYALPLGPEEAHGEALMWMLSGGGGLTDSSGSYVIDSAPNIAAFTWLRDVLVGGGLTGPREPAVTGRREAFTAFAAGEVGMLNGQPALLRLADRGKIDCGTATLPGKDGPSQHTMGVADWIMGFDNGRRRAAGRFLDFVFQRHNVKLFADRYETLPVTLPARESMLEAIRHQRLTPFLQQLERASFYPVGKVSWAEVSLALRQEIGAAVLPDGDPEAALRSLQERAERAEKAAREG